MSEIKKVESEELKIIKIDYIKDLKNAGPTLEKILNDNPFIEPTNQTINAAEISRKALKVGRTTVERYRKDIKSKLSKAGKSIDEIAEDLKLIVESAEIKQADANNKYFDEKAWLNALEVNTRECYTEYAGDFFLHTDEAQEKVIEIQAAEEKAKQIQAAWYTKIYELISLAQNLENLEKVVQKLDAEDLEKFIDPNKAFEDRDKFYVLIDTKKVSVEKAEALRIENERIEKERQDKAEKERIEREKLEKEREALVLRNKIRNEELRPYIVFIRDYNALLESDESEYQKQFADIKKGAELQREFELKQKKEADAKAAKEKQAAETLRIENEKKASEAKILKHLESYNNALETFDLIDMSIGGVSDIEQLNIYSGKIEGIVERDFGENESEIKDKYTDISQKLTTKRNALNAELQKQKAIDAKRLQEEQAEEDEKTKAEEAKVKAEQDKIAEAKRLEDEEYKRNKSQALEQIFNSLNAFDVFENSKEDIEKYNVKDDIIQYISNLLN